MQRCIECGDPFDVGAPYCAVHNRMLYGVVIAPSKIPNAGYGMFAARAFHPTEKICPWQGEIQPLDTELTDEEEVYVLETRTHLINAFKAKNLAFMANTAASKDGTKSTKRGCNAIISWMKSSEPWMVASKNIAEGDEILCFYGHEFRMLPPASSS